MLQCRQFVNYLIPSNNHAFQSVTKRFLNHGINRDYSLTLFDVKTPAIIPYDPPKPNDIVRINAWNVGQSRKRVNRVARLIRKMTLHDALLQVQFCQFRCARDIYAALMMGYKEAVPRFGIEDSTQLHVFKSYVGKGIIMKRKYPRAKGKCDIEKDVFSHYFLEIKPYAFEEPKKLIRLTSKEKWLATPPSRIPYSLYNSRVSYLTLEDTLGPKLSKNINRDMLDAL